LLNVAGLLFYMFSSFAELNDGVTVVGLSCSEYECFCVAGWQWTSTISFHYESHLTQTPAIRLHFIACTVHL